MKFIVIQTFGNSQMNLFGTFLDENIRFSKLFSSFGAGPRMCKLGACMK
jgi:hypothetical protein